MAWGSEKILNKQPLSLTLRQSAEMFRKIEEKNDLKSASSKSGPWAKDRDMWNPSHAR